MTSSSWGVGDRFNIAGVFHGSDPKYITTEDVRGRCLIGVHLECLPDTDTIVAQVNGMLSSVWRMDGHTCWINHAMCSGDYWSIRYFAETWEQRVRRTWDAG